MRTLPAIRLLLMGCAGFYLTSYSSGPTPFKGDMTGSPLSTRTCESSDCHGGGTYEPVTSLAVLDERGQAVNEYRAGGNYSIRISVATTEQPGAYGYQLVALGAADTLDAGSFGQLPLDFQLSPFEGRTYVEHDHRIESDTVLIPWTAPTAGSDTVQIYAIANAVNGTGGKAGDVAARAQLSLPGAVDTTGTDTTETSATDYRRLAASWRAYTRDGALTVELADTQEFQPTTLLIHAADGRLLVKTPLSPGTSRRIQVPIPPGILFVASLLESGSARISTKLIAAGR